MPFTATIDAERFVLNGQCFREAVPPERFYSVLGLPDRIEATSQPAPIGHRNNQIHLYDDLGLYLIEHHFTFLVEGIVFVLWREEAAFRPKAEIEGELRVGDIVLTPGIAEFDMGESNLPFVSQLRGSWQFKTDDMWVGFDSKGERNSTGRRSKRRRVVSVAVCLKHDPWDARFRKEPVG